MPPLARSLPALHWPAAARPWLRRCAVLLALAAAGASLLLGPMAAASSPGALGANPQTAAPLAVAQGAPPLVMLTMACDHTLFYEAYNDASDVNGDGRLDDNFANDVRVQRSAVPGRISWRGDGRRDDNGDDNGDSRRDDNFANDVPVQRSVVPRRISWREIIR